MLIALLSGLFANSIVSADWVTSIVNFAGNYKGNSSNADYYIEGKAGIVLPKIVDAIRTISIDR